MKTKLTVTIAVLVLVIAYIVSRNDFHVLKSLVGYRVPPLVTVSPETTPSVQNGFMVPNGLTMSVFATGLINPRVMAFDPAGSMLVSETRQGRVSLVEDADGSGTSEKRVTILQGLRTPHGLAFYTDEGSGKTYLYVAESHQVTRYEYDASARKVLTKAQRVISYGDGGRHTTRTIAVMPDRSGTTGRMKLYTSVGSSCDVCVEDDWKRGAILESDPDGTNLVEFAGGLRNSVFFTLHPGTQDMWGTDMGRDHLGDELPPDEVNRIEAGKKYGWPFCYGNQVRDAKFAVTTANRSDLPRDCSATVPSRIDIPAHSAPLGLAFIIHGSWPQQWKNHLLVAYHGSWNRSVPTGYKIVRFALDAGGNPVRNSDGSSQKEDFITGWFDGTTIVGRPAGMVFDNNGALYISDDAAGVIYKVVPSQS